MSLCTEVEQGVVCCCTVSDIGCSHDDMHLSLQWGETALIKAYDKGHMECVKVLLDNGAQVNMKYQVSDVIIHCVHAMLHVTRVPSSA